MGVTSQIESERKYDVDEWTELPDLSRVARVERSEPVMLRATYFDTPDRALAEARITLRRRVGGGDEGWHLKTPEGADGRREHHAPLADGTGGGEPPRELLEPVRSLIGDRALVEVARLHTERITVRLIRDERPIAEVADDLVSSTDVRTGVLRVWREWECELLSGAPEEREEREGLLDRIEGLLLSAGARPASSASKLQRATARWH